MKPILPLNQDVKEIDLPEGSVFFRRNALISEQQGSNVNENGNVTATSILDNINYDINTLLTVLNSLQTDYTLIDVRVIGIIPIDNDDSILFLWGKDGSNSNYSIIVKEQFSLDNVDDPNSNFNIYVFKSDTPTLQFNFNPNYPINGEFQRDSNNQLVVAFTDNYNKPKYINLDTYDPTKDITTFFLFPEYDTPILDSVSTIEGEGTVKTGAWHYYIQYSNIDGTQTNPSAKITTQYVNQDAITLGVSITGSLGGLQSNKSIQLNLSNVDHNYDYINLLAVYYSNGVASAYQIKQVLIGGATTINIVHNGSEQYLALALEDILVDFSFYSKIKVLTQLNRVLFGGNVKTNLFSESQNTEIQNAFNTVVVDCITDGDTTFSNSIKALSLNKGTLALVGNNNRSLAYGETYALYASLIMNDGSLSKAYHIPGRDAVNIVLKSDKLASTNIIMNERDILTDPNTDLVGIADVSHLTSIHGVKLHQVFDCSYNSNAIANDGATNVNIGFWENQDEQYPYITGTTIHPDYANIPGVNSNRNVRHHRTPYLTTLRDKAVTEQIGVDKLPILQFLITNINIPSDILPLIKGYKFSIAKRDIGSGTVIDTGELYPCHFQKSDNGDPLAAHTLDPDADTKYGGSGWFTYWDYFAFNWFTYCDGKKSDDNAGHQLNNYRYWRFNSYITNALKPILSSGSSYIRNELALEKKPVTLFTPDYEDKAIAEESRFRSTLSYNEEKYYVSRPIWARDKSLINGDIVDGTLPDPDPSKDHGNNTNRYNRKSFHINIVSDYDYILNNSLQNKNNNIGAQDNLFLQFRTPPPVNQWDIKNNYTSNWIYTSAFAPFFTNYVAGSVSELQQKFPYVVAQLDLRSLRGSIAINSYWLNGDPTYTSYDGSQVPTSSLSPDGINTVAYTGTFISTLCIYKENVYSSFNSQQLVDIGNVYLKTNTSPGDLNTPLEGDCVLGTLRVVESIALPSDFNGNSTALNTGSYGVRFTKEISVNSLINVNMIYEDLTKIGADDFGGPTFLGVIYPKSDFATVTGFRFQDKANQYLYNKDFNNLGSDLNKNTPYYPFGVIINDFPYRVIRSNNLSTEGSFIGWRRWLSNNYYEMPKNKGEIINLEAFNQDVLFIHHRYCLYYTREIGTIQTNITDLTLGTQDIFNFPPQEILTSALGHGGTQHLFGCIMTPYGYLFTDAEQGRLYLVIQGEKGGHQLVSVDPGLTIFFRDYLKTMSTLKLGAAINKTLNCNSNGWFLPYGDEPSDWANYPYKYDNPFNYKGISSAYDVKQRRLILSFINDNIDITDFNTWVEEKNICLSYDLLKGWISSHDNTSNFIWNTRNKVFNYMSRGSFVDLTVANLGKKGAYQPNYSGDNLTISVSSPITFTISGNNIVISVNTNSYNLIKRIKVGFKLSIDSGTSFPFTIIDISSASGQLILQLDNPTGSISSFKIKQIYPFTVDVPYSFPEPVVLDSVRWVTETKQNEINKTYKENQDLFNKTLTHITVRSNYQVSERVVLSSNNIETMLEDQANNMRSSETVWSFNKFRDSIINKGNKFLNSIFKNFSIIESNVDINSLSWYKQRRFINKWFIIRYEFDNLEDNDVYLIETSITVKKSQR